MKGHSLSMPNGRQMNIMRPRERKNGIRPINYIIVFKLNPQFNVNDVNAITQIHRTFAIFIFYLSFSHTHVNEMYFPVTIV